MKDEETAENRQLTKTNVNFMLFVSRQLSVFFILHPSSFILHPSSFS